jgi:hypothetical protein
MKQNPSNKTQIIVVSSLLAFGMLILIALLVFLFRGNMIQLAAPVTATAPIPTIIIPTVDCGSPTLLLGASTFQIQNLTPAADGSFSVPPDTSGIAYWLEGTDTNPLFVVSPTPGNMAAMSAVTVGSPAKVTWKNCNSTTYSLSAGQAATLDIPTLSSDQSTEGITIFFQTDVSGAGFVYKGELTEQQLSTINTPVPSEMQAEISLLETTASSDGASIRIGISIQNFGSAPFTVSINDVSLTAQDGSALTMTNSEPPLPKEIAAGATETMYFTFPKPASPTATLKIFTVEFDIEGY